MRTMSVTMAYYCFCIDVCDLQGREGGISTQMNSEDRKFSRSKAQRVFLSPETNSCKQGLGFQLPL